MERTEQAVPVQQSKGGKRVAKGDGSALKAGLLAAGITAGILGAAYLGLCAYAANQDTIWKNTSVLGQDLGGLTVPEAAQKLEAALPELDVGVYFHQHGAPCNSHEGEPDAKIPFSELDIRIDPNEKAQYAFDCNAATDPASFLTAGWRYFSNQMSNQRHSLYTIPAAEDINYSAQTVAAKKYADAFTVHAQDTAYELTDSSVLVTTAEDGRLVSPQELESQLGQSLFIHSSDLTIDVPYSVDPAEVRTAQQLHDEIAGEMKNAGYDAATDTIIPERVGADFDVAAAQALMDAAAPGETVEIPAEIQRPAVTAEELRAVLFRDVLGSAKTHVSGTAARISNVKLASAAVNGTILNPGDVFSYNETTGQRTTAKGYRPAPAYVAGETVDEVGGGVCQPSSTLYLACLNSNLEIVERYAHRYVPAYIGKGMDATVSWGGPDYKFRNDTDYPIKIEAVYDKGYLTMNIYGTKTDDITVKMVYEHISTTPFEVVYEDDPTLAPGEEKVKTTPYTGYKGRTYRNLYDGDGKLISSTYEDTSTYRVRNKVILRGPTAESGVPAIGGLPFTDPEPVDPGVLNPGEAADPAGPDVFEPAFAGGENDAVQQEPVGIPGLPTLDPLTPEG